ELRQVRPEPRFVRVPGALPGKVPALKADAFSHGRAAGLELRLVGVLPRADSFRQTVSGEHHRGRSALRRANRLQAVAHATSHHRNERWLEVPLFDKADLE